LASLRDANVKPAVEEDVDAYKQGRNVDLDVLVLTVRIHTQSFNP
jgi:hypothetical protein